MLCVKSEKRTQKECKRGLIRRKNYALEVKRYRTETRIAKSCVKPDFTVHLSSLQTSSALQTKTEWGGKIFLLCLFQGACWHWIERCLGGFKEHLTHLRTHSLVLRSAKKRVLVQILPCAFSFCQNLHHWIFWKNLFRGLVLFASVSINKF